jgi:hypothetical protein
MRNWCSTRQAMEGERHGICAVPLLFVPGFVPGGLCVVMFARRKREPKINISLLLTGWQRPSQMDIQSNATQHAWS